MMSEIVVFRVIDEELIPVGTIARSGAPTFSYLESYLERADASCLSLSLPLTRDVYAEWRFKPYFEGLLPEGPMREAMAARLEARVDDYLTLLSSNGLDCIGDVVVCRRSEGLAWDAGKYVPLDMAGLQAILSDLSSQARSNVAARLSLAGTQGKVGLAHMPNAPMDQGWMRPLGGAASTHILKTSSLNRIAEFELICMASAPACGISAADTDMILLGEPVVCSNRYDRSVSAGHEGCHVERLHQEDLAQAFGVSSAAKYLELEDGTYHRIAQLLYEHSSSVLADIDQLARLAAFDYIVGNCDNHLKNLAVLHQGESVRLAPAYDLVCTTFFERYSREMGKRLGSTRAIDKVSPNDFLLLADELGLGHKRMRSICGEVAANIVDAVMGAGERFGAVLPTLPFAAEDLIGEMEPRLKVVRRV